MESEQAKQLTETNPEQIDTGSIGPFKPIRIKGRVDDDIWFVRILVLGLAVILQERWGGESDALSVLLAVGMVWALGTLCRDLLWQWSRPVLTLDSGRLRWRMDSERRYIEVNLAEVDDCGFESGYDFRVTLHSGVEHTFNLGNFSDAQEDDVVAALEEIAARNQERTRVR
ncbi:MAG: hypothetical protein GY930_12770 [bacterium]|nr:hypothetical protein [bacterium]